jgi:hypothetical protein
MHRGYHCRLPQTLVAGSAQFATHSREMSPHYRHRFFMLCEDAQLVQVDTCIQRLA